jgi:hypothetical protein
MSTAEQEARQMIADKKAAAAAEKAYNAASSTPAAPAASTPSASKPKRSSVVQEAMQEAEDEKARKKIKAMGFSKGGGVKRGDGCVTKGHTKGTMVSMQRGGKC